MAGGGAAQHAAHAQSGRLCRLQPSDYLGLLRALPVSIAQHARPAKQRCAKRRPTRCLPRLLGAPKQPNSQAARQPGSQTSLDSHLLGWRDRSNLLQLWAQVLRSRRARRFWQLLSSSALN